MRLAYITRILAPGNLSTFSLAADGLPSSLDGGGVRAWPGINPGGTLRHRAGLWRHPSPLQIKYRQCKDTTMDLPEFLVVFCTAPAGEAEMIAKALVDARLAACVNVTGVQSCFRWEGTVSSEPEELLIVKTQQRLLDQLIARIRGLHSYETPEIIAIPIVGGYAPYLDWIGEETA